MKHFYTVYPKTFEDFSWKSDWQENNHHYSKFACRASFQPSSYYEYGLEVSYCKDLKTLCYAVNKVEKYGPNKELIEVFSKEYDTENQAIRWLLDKLESLYQTTKIGFKLPYTAVDLIYDKNTETALFLLNASLYAKNSYIREEAKILEKEFIKMFDYYNFYTNIAAVNYPYLTEKLIRYLKTPLEYDQQYFEKLLETEVY